ncbi:MAG: M3 family oligoendopeptidase [Pleurocapsa minor GSE-CHR-MK-17-07R]|nr:M3 family oligoendopeptidase [Pleurocapsa minor GSE-CHR-MK 17-07R]
MMAEASVQKTTGAENVLWDLSVFYASVDDPAIAADIAKALEMADEYAKLYRGRVKDLSAAEIASAVRDSEAIEDFAGRIGSYAGLLYSTDTNDPRYGALMQKVQEFGSTFSQKMMFFGLEWKALDDAHQQKILKDPALGAYRHVLEADLRYKKYMLSEPEEQLLVEKSVTGSSSWTRLFTQLNSAMRFDVDGEKLTQSQVLKLSYDGDRAVRQKAADAVTTTLREYSMQTTFIFNVLAADKASDDARRGYPSWISSRNLSNKAPDAVVDALVNAVTSNYEIVARHYRLKRTLLGLDELFEYDRYAPLNIKGAERDYSWSEAREIVTNAYERFSPITGAAVKRFFDENWIDAALQPNKRGGAFASPTVPSAHPFVFMNYTGKGRDVSTLAHELGHGLHMYLTNQKQPMSYVYTPLTTAEMASVFGEMLVFNDLLSRETDAAARLAMTASKIEDSFATIFRQTSMNRFEHGYHTARRTEGELSTERLSQIWLDTQRSMFGDSVTLREDYGLWWSYIPHFLNTPGYVYAYAFGELLVLALFNVYQKRGAEFVPAYLEVLGAGDSDYPENILAKAGVNLSDPSFWNEGLQTLSDLVTQEEKLAREVFPDKF